MFIAGDKNAEKTIVDSLNDLGIVIDSYKEREYKVKSGGSSQVSPSNVPEPVYRSDTRLKNNKSLKKKSMSSRSLSTARLTPLDRGTDRLTPVDSSRVSNVATPVSGDDVTSHDRGNGLSQD